MNKTDSKIVEATPFGLPPPPPFPANLYSNRSIGAKHISDVNDNVTDDKSASLERAMKLLKEVERCFYEKPFYIKNISLQSQLQEGPKCGLVALSMATSKSGDFKSVDELFSEAIKLGYTTQGEMYSAEGLACLVNRMTRFKSLIVAGGINSHLDCIFHLLQIGGLMLVPYDSDRNHSPCCNHGHTAHWAVISGMIIFGCHSSDEGNNDSNENIHNLNLRLDGELPCRCLTNREFFGIMPHECDIRIQRENGSVYVVRNTTESGATREGRLYLAGKHGKSKHLALWPWEKLAESNNNLEELSEQQKEKNFALPEGGVREGLRGKAILILPLD